MADNDDDDDYMNMDFSAPAEASSKKTESSIQRRARLQREGMERAHIKSKAEIAAEEAEKREAALATSLDSSNRGFRMMAKLGFKGGALGKDSTQSLTEPIKPVMKEDRGGIGLDTDKKRKFREEVGEVEKRMKMDEGEYRERLRTEKEQKRIEGQIIAAMKVAEGLDEEEIFNGKDKQSITTKEKQDDEESQKAKPPSRPLKSINVLWRGLVKHQQEKERERRMRYDLHQSLSRLPTYEDPEEDAEDKRAFGREEEELEEEDPELDEFSALEPSERLAKLVEYMRTTWYYCFWCKFKYPDEAMDGCPGLTEADHD